MVGAVQSFFAYRVADQQARMGVDPDRAVEHAMTVSNAVIAYVMTIFPMTVGVALFVWTDNIPIMLWKVMVIALGVVITIRLHRYAYSRADVRLVYQVPTVIFVCLGLIMVPMGLLACSLSYLTTPYQY